MKEYTAPLLTNLFYILGWISLFGGIIIYLKLWTIYPGYDDVVSYAVLITGVIQFSFFMAIGEGLSYLKQIAINTSKED